MIARAEMSPNAQSTEPQSSAPKGMAVALIGPNDTHRHVVARALASAQGRKVHEFIDYPEALSDLPQMMEVQHFDAVLVDVDSDESYALQIIEKLAQMGTTVMAYSARSDQELLMSCMRAGARDFLPLPTENQPTLGAEQPAVRPVATAPQPTKPVVAAASQPLPKPVAAALPSTPRPVETRPIAAPEPPASRFNVTAIAPEKREPAAEPWPLRVPETGRSTPEIEKVSEEPKTAEELDILKPEVMSDFAAWDAANLRRGATPQVSRPETRPRPSLVPERRKSEPAARAVPVAPEPHVETAPAPASPIERPPVPVELFRSVQLQSEANETAEKQGANWVRWILIAAGPVVLALVLLVVFTRSSSPNSSATQAKAAPAVPVKTEEDPTATDQLIVNATGKPAAAVPATTPKPNPAQAQPQGSTPVAQDPTPVSPDAMAAQLVAPARIAGQIKRAPQAEEPPPAAPAAVALDDNNSVPGSVFGASKVKALPHVVPISAGLAEGMLIRKTTPVYPKFAQDAHISGTVVLKATITKQGTIEGVQVVSGPKILAPSAADAVKTWKYRPYMLDGQPVSVETNITVVFGAPGR